MRCKDGKHSLEVIYCGNNGFEQEVVRWCNNCGAVVVDADTGRTFAGAVMKMKFPKETLDR